MSYYTEVQTPVGPVTIISDGTALTSVSMRPAADCISRDCTRDDDRLAAAAQQLLAYFNGELREFTLPLNPRGTSFQRSVWDALRRIPYGQTCSYAEIARAVGAPGSARAVGAANGQNPIGIIVPCHRVIGADGSLTGYAGGVARKQWLLEHEARISGGQMALFEDGGGQAH